MPRVPVNDENGQPIGDTCVPSTAGGILTGITLRRKKPKLSGELTSNPLGQGEIRGRALGRPLADDEDDR
jgi:hypothetical protein